MKIYNLFKLNKAFTLVELIVVITILAILWTIAFISFQWYSKTSRDSVRISDMNNIEKAMELFYLDVNKYPEPSHSNGITYSWSIVLWYQWLFWDQTKNNLRYLDKLPVDPLSQKEYTYSVTNNKQEYELAWIRESEDFAYINLNNLYAWDNLAYTIIKWNYNWFLLKSSDFIFSIPSIINGDMDFFDIKDILNNNTLIYNWYRNLPDNYKNSDFNHNWEGDFDILNSTYLILYEWDINKLFLNNKEWSYFRYNFIENWILSLTWTDISNNSVLSELLNLDLSKKSDIEIYANSILAWISSKTTPWKDFSSWNGYDWTIDVACLWASIWDVIYESTWTSNDTWLNCSHDIAICTWDWTWYIINSCNVWAKSIDINNTDSYWLYFQYWRNKWFSFWDNTQFSTPIDNTLFNQLDDNYWFVWWPSISSNRNDWLLSPNENIWWEPSSDPLDRKWPCQYWYHIPSNSEWVWVVQTNWDLADANLWTEMRDELKLPFWWWRFFDSWLYFNQWLNWYYWSTTSCCDNSLYLTFRNWSINATYNYARAFWFNIRCFKN